MRFHFWYPLEAAFHAADELGFYHQVECAAWANQGASNSEGDPLDAQLYEESERIIAAYGTTPLFLMLAYGTEPAGKQERPIERQLRYSLLHYMSSDQFRLRVAVDAAAIRAILQQPDFELRIGV